MAGECARIYHSVSQAVPSGGWQQLVFDSVTFDTDGFYSAAGLNIQIPTGKAGVYLVGAGVGWALNANSYRGMALRINGASYHGMDIRGACNGIGTYHTFQTIIELDALDVVDLMAQQMTGGPLNADRVVDTCVDLSVIRLCDG